jgi:hypothetical protein
MAKQVSVEELTLKPIEKDQEPMTATVSSSMGTFAVTSAPGKPRKPLPSRWNRPKIS